MVMERLLVVVAEGLGGREEAIPSLDRLRTDRYPREGALGYVRLLSSSVERDGNIVDMRRSVYMPVEEVKVQRCECCLAFLPRSRWILDTL